MNRQTRSHLLRYCFILMLVMSPLGCRTTKTTVSRSAKQLEYLNTANQYAKEGLLREALGSYKRALLIEPNDFTAHRNMGLVLVKVGDYKSAISHLESALKIFNSDFDTNYYLGEAFRGRHKFSEAIFHYQKALKIRKKDVKTLKALAWSYFSIRYYSGALVIAKKLTKIAPNDVQIAIITARTLLRLKRPREAFKALRSVKQRANKQDLAYLQSIEGNIRFELGDFDKAAKLYRVVLQEQPLMASALFGLGKYYLLQKKLQKGITYIQRALRIRPKLVEAYYYLGLAFESIDPKKSIRYYQNFYKLGSTDPEFLGLIKKSKKRVGALGRQVRGRY